MTEVDLNFAMVLSQRQESANVGMYFKTYPYRWQKIGRVLIDERDLVSIEAFEKCLKGIVEENDLPDGFYSLKGFGVRHRCMPNHNHTKWRRSYVSFIQFEVENGYVRIHEHRVKKGKSCKYKAISMIEQFAEALERIERKEEAERLREREEAIGIIMARNEGLSEEEVEELLD